MIAASVATNAVGSPRGSPLANLFQFSTNLPL
jgi:hypothetical protein